MERGCRRLLWFFFFNDTATTEIYTLSLHDALPIFATSSFRLRVTVPTIAPWSMRCEDRKSTRLNSSHLVISYAVLCLKQKKNQEVLIRGLRKQTTQKPGRQAEFVL